MERIARPDLSVGISNGIFIGKSDTEIASRITRSSAFCFPYRIAYARATREACTLRKLCGSVESRGRFRFSPLGPAKSRLPTSPVHRIRTSALPSTAIVFEIETAAMGSASQLRSFARTDDQKRGGRPTLTGGPCKLSPRELAIIPDLERWSK